MEHGANAVHRQLRKALEDYIKSQYFGKSPLLLAAIEEDLKTEGVLYRRPYIESSPAYKTVANGIQASGKIEGWLKAYFGELAEEKLGVFKSPFAHQVMALEAAQEGRDVFVSTGTGSGKTECFMWPLMAKLAVEARIKTKSWRQRGVRVVIMYPMNALVSDQVGRLRRLIGDPGHRFATLFRKTCGQSVRRPQFGMYTGRTPYPGPEPRQEDDRRLEKIYSEMLHPQKAGDNEKGGDNGFLEKLRNEGKLPAKENFDDFLRKLHDGIHVPDAEDAELVTRFEMQRCCPDILITNYSMLEYMLIRPREKKIWEDTRKWLDCDPENKLLFVIDEAHMYRGSAGGEVALLLRRLFHRLGISRDRVQFILTTASMPNRSDEDRTAVKAFANALTASDGNRSFCYLVGEKEELNADGGQDIPIDHFLEADAASFEGDDVSRLEALNAFWRNMAAPVPFTDVDVACHWLYEHLGQFRPFQMMFRACRGTAVSLDELAGKIFPGEEIADALQAVSVMLAMAPLAHDQVGNVLFPARMHMLFRGIKGVYACTNPRCSHAHSEGGLTLGEIFLSDGHLTCPHCGSQVYELYNDRRCGALYFKGYVLTKDLESHKKTYLWRQPGINVGNEIKEIHLFIPSDDYLPPGKQGKNKVTPCYLDVESGFIDFGDDALAGTRGIRKLYYSDLHDKGKPEVLTFSTCPHCRHQLSKMQLTSFSTRGNLSFFNLVKAQFLAQPAVPSKAGKLEEFPNEGRKVLLFSDSRQRAAKLARDMSEASDMDAARQLAALAIDRMEHSKGQYSLDMFYTFFAMAAAERHLHLFHDADQKQLLEHGRKALRSYRKSTRRGLDFVADYSISSHAPSQMKALFLKLYCGGYNTLVTTGVSWIEPCERYKWDAIDDLKDDGFKIEEDEFLYLFNAWMMWACDSHVALGHSIPDEVRAKVRQNYIEFGLEAGWSFPNTIRELMGWKEGDHCEAHFARAFQDHFMEMGTSGRYYIDLARIQPRLDRAHEWYCCEQCSELTPFLLKGACPSCKSENVRLMNKQENGALEFWRAPISDAIAGKAIRVIDTEEHTAQLSHKDQRDDLWAKTEQYELRFQDFLQDGESPVDILSSTTTMEVGIDIGSLVAVGLRNIPPMRENYQQRAGRAGRRGASLSTIVTFCEDGPHDALYFSNPVPMFRGDSRRPWIDICSEKIVQRHLSMVSLLAYLTDVQQSMDDISAMDFLDQHLNPFREFLTTYRIPENDILLPVQSEVTSDDYKDELLKGLGRVKVKRDKHPELFETESGHVTHRKSLLDALYEEGLVPTYSFPKNVVSAYIPDQEGKIAYEVERGLDVAIGEYAPGRAIVVDKKTYQIGGLYCPVNRKNWILAKTPAKAFAEDENYRKSVLTCTQCGWFGLEDDHVEKCPFCGNENLSRMREMLRPWGFAPRDGCSVETMQLNEEFSAIQQPLYSTLPDADDVSEIMGCANIRLAVRSNQRIIMLNKGNNDKGFMVCSDCGAAMPGNDSDVLKRIKQPYRLRNNGWVCKHTNAVNVNLGYDFITDMLVLEFKLDRNRMEVCSDKGAWLSRAGQSLAEALRLAACKELDIEFTELVTGYRIRKTSKGDYMDIYIYDSLSSGAGYAVGIAAQLKGLFQETRRLLEACSCETACYKCLKHYRNQHVHAMLDRHAALNLLDWGEKGKLPAKISFEKQKALLSPLKQMLSRFGLDIGDADGEIHVRQELIDYRLEIYPAMWARPKIAGSLYFSDAQMKYERPKVVEALTHAFEK